MLWGTKFMNTKKFKIDMHAFSIGVLAYFLCWLLGPLFSMLILMGLATLYIFNYLLSLGKK